MATVVIPCRNAVDSIREVIGSVRAQSVADRLVVVVVDNGSVDGTGEAARGLADLVVVERRRGIAHARNAGIACARTPFVLGLDADCLPADTGWAAAHLDALAGAPDGVAATAGPVLAAPSDSRWSRRPEITPSAPFGEDGPNYAIGGNHGAVLEILRQVGGYPDYEADDAGLGLTLRRNGYRYLWVPEAVVYHRNPTGMWGYYRQMRKVGRYAAGIDGQPPGGVPRWLLHQALETAGVGLRHTLHGRPTMALAHVVRRVAQARGALDVWRRDR